MKQVFTSKPSLTVYYDEDCPLCNRTRICFQHFDFREKIEWKGIGQASSDPRMEGIAASSLFESMHAVTKKGQIVTGVDTYIQLTRRIPLLFALSL